MRAGRPPSPRTRLVLGGLLVAALAALPLVAEPVADQASADAGTPPVAAEGIRPLPQVRKAAAPDAPNIILITTDDQTLDDLRHMPQTRKKLGQQGAVFKDMVSPHPLCCPARAEILSGQYAQNNGVHSNGGEWGGYMALREPDNTLQRWLYEAGYHTAVVGKFINYWFPETQAVPLGWEWFDASAKNSFGYYDFDMFTNGERTRYDDGESYSTTYTTERTVQLVEDWSAGRDPLRDGAPGEDKPFFIWTSYYAPHGECGEGSCKVGPAPEKRYRDLYPGATPPSFAKASYDARLDDPNPHIKGKAVLDRDRIAQFHRQRIQSLRSVDDGVTAIVRALRAAGELDDTVVMFTSDNGYLLGEHRYLGKTLAYEEALRVPLLVRGPGIARRTKVKEPVTTVDLASTVVDLAGATPGRTLDGRSLAGAARGQGRLRADTVLVQAGARSARAGTGPWMFRGVRTDRYTLTKWRKRSGRIHIDLFDRRRDPEQVDNLAGSRRYRPVRLELKKRLRALDGCAGSDCFQRFGPVPAPRRG